MCAMNLKKMIFVNINYLIKQNILKKLKAKIYLAHGSWTLFVWGGWFLTILAVWLWDKHYLHPDVLYLITRELESLSLSQLPPPPVCNCTSSQYYSTPVVLHGAPSNHCLELPAGGPHNIVSQHQVWQIYSLAN